MVTQNVEIWIGLGRWERNTLRPVFGVVLIGSGFLECAS
jgi:hypothetical protein